MLLALGLLTQPLDSSWGSQVVFVFNSNIRFEENSIVFTGETWIPEKFGGITIGNVILVNDNHPSEKVIRHEIMHTYQSYFLGPLYIPAHLLFQTYSNVACGDYASCNPLEYGPYRHRIF